MEKRDEKGRKKVIRKYTPVLLIVSFLLVSTVVPTLSMDEEFKENTLEEKTSLLITEVYYREDDDMDFIAIHNPSDVSVSMTSFEITDGDDAWIFPSGANIDSHEDIYVASNGMSFEERMSFEPDWEVKNTLSGVPNMEERGDFRLDESGGEVILKGYYDTVIDVVAFGDSDYQGVGWNNGPAPGVSPGEILTREWIPEKGYVDTNTSDDWVHPFIKRVGQSDFEIRSFDHDGKVETFVSPDSSFKAVSDFIDSTEQKMYLNGYMLTNWFITERIIDAVDRGVEVKIFLEGGPVGGINDQQRYNVMRLADAGVEIRYMIHDPDEDIYSRYRYNHAKYSVADNSSVLITTENWVNSGIPINNTYGNRGWGITVHNEDLATYYADVFLTDYDPRAPDSYAYDPNHERYGDPPDDFTPDKEPRESYYDPVDAINTVEGEMDIVPVIGPDNTRAKEHSIIPAIREAEESLNVVQLICGIDWGRGVSVSIDWDLSSETQYLRWEDGREHHNLYLKEIIEAARRGIEVNVLLDSLYVDRTEENTFDNYDVMLYLNEVAEKEDIPLNARLAEHDELGLEKIHAKGMVIDNETVFVSSINWGAYAAMHNRETGLFVTHEDVAGYFADAFYYDWTTGTVDNREDWIEEDPESNGEFDTGENEFKGDTLETPSPPDYPEIVVDVGLAVVVLLSLMMAAAFVWDKVKNE